MANRNKIALDNNTYLDSGSIEHNNELLSTFLNSKTINSSGSNSNGNWIKFEDGTMFQYGKKIFSDINITTQYGEIYHASLSGIYFPVSFIDDDITINCTVQNSGIGGLLITSYYSNRFNCTIWNGRAWNGASMTVHWFAFGKWK